MEQLLTSRRQALMLLMTAAAASRAQESLPPIVVAGKRSMIVHNDMPEDLESPVSYLNQWLTPTDSFFVRQHLPRPRVEEATFQLRITGHVAEERPLRLDDLRKLPQYTIPAVLECTGNARSFFSPRVPGIQWG